MHADLLNLLDECRERGVVLSLEDGRLRARSDAAALTPALRESLRQHRDALIDVLRGQQSATATHEPVRRVREGDQPVSSAQHRLWFVTELAPESSTAYHIIAAVRIRGALDLTVFERALNEVVRRHDTLRTAFVSVQREPRQRIHPSVTLPLRHVALDGDDASIDRWLDAESREPFDLRVAPLARGVIGRIAEDDHAFALILHHLISDGWSSGVLIQEIAALYEAFLTGAPSPLPDLPVQYSDYVEWQREELTGPAYDAAIAFWKQQLTGVPTLNLPTDHPRPPRPTYAGTSERFRLRRALAEALEQTGRQDGATLYMVLMAGFAALLSRYSGQTDLAVGTTVANRPHTAFEPLIGFFTNMLALRTDLGGDPTFTELVRRVRDTSRAAFAQQHVPFDRVVDAAQPERLASHNPLVQVCFSLLQAHRDTLRLGTTQVTLLDAPSPASRFDLTLTLEDTSDGLIGAFEYSTDLFNRDTIQRLIEHFSVLLHHAAAHPDTRLSALPLLTPAERQRLLVEWNDSTTAYPRTSTVHELFEAMAAARPDAIAVRADDGVLTYATLNARANQLARALRARGVGPDVAVAVAALRSADMVVELVATLKAGGYYVPFDPADPPERLGFVFDQVHPKVMLAPARTHGVLAPHGIEILSAADPALSAFETHDLAHATHPDNLVYTTYTSGSTGVPKGICIPHRGVVRLVRDTNYMVFEPSLVFLEVAPVSFDASTLELWGALCNGATLVVLPPEVPSLRELGASIERHGITSLYLTSALFNLMVDERVEAFAHVKHLLVGGDIISVPHARRLLAANPGVTLINGYGPTETTTFASCGIMARPEDVGYTVTIGRPISNTTLYVLDRYFEPTPTGVPGDLYIAGDGNARGYLNLPSLTAATFIPNPYGAPGDRMYRTGDLARYLADGTLEFLGRKDHQVKVRGFRIELGEIENVLAAIAGVSEAAVIVDEVRAGDKRLIAYVQPKPGHALTDADCVAALRAKLPEYMVPSAFVFIDTLPLTPHNKIDRKALRAITPSRDRAGASAPPATPLERAIAGIWQDVLGVPHVDATDNFFDLGGHSLLATQIMWRIFEVFDVEVPLRRLFDAPTVTAFATALQDIAGNPARLTRVAELYEEVRQLSADDVSARLEDAT